MKIKKIDDLLAMYAPEAARFTGASHLSSKSGVVPPAIERLQSKPERAAIKARILSEVDNFFDRRIGPFKTAEIFAAMTNAGLVIPGKDPRNNLSAMLSNSDEFVSTPDGWVRAGSELAPEVAGAPDAETSEAPKSGADTPVNRAPQGAMSHAGGG